MSIELPQDRDPRQLDSLSPLAHFKHLLPANMVAADKGAYQLQRATPKSEALKLSEIRPNDAERIICIVVDVDAEPVREIDPISGEEIFLGTGASTWIDAGVAEPNLIIENPVSGHAHLVYLLQDVLWPQKQGSKVVDYAKAIQKALTDAIPGADPHFNWPSSFMHSPFSELYTVRELRKPSYRLDELAQGLDSARPPRTRRSKSNDESDADAANVGRNFSLFRFALNEAYSVMRASETKASYEKNLHDLAFDRNSAFSPPMIDKEVRGIVKSVLKYRKYDPNGRPMKNTKDYRKEHRHAQGRTRERYEAPTREREIEAHRLRALGLTLKEIARRLGVVIRTVARYLKNKIQNLIGASALQDKGVPGHLNDTPAHTEATPEKDQIVMNIMRNKQPTPFSLLYAHAGRNGLPTRDRLEALISRMSLPETYQLALLLPWRSCGEKEPSAEQREDAKRELNELHGELLALVQKIAA